MSDAIVEPVGGDVPVEIIKVLLKVQKNLKPLVKTSDNTAYGSKFTPLPEVMEAALNLLNKHKVVVIQSPTLTTEGASAFRTTLAHESGASYSEVTKLAIEKINPQAHASAITYMRRYQLMAMLGLTSEDDDDDGNKAANALAPVAKEQIDHIKVLLRDLKWTPDQIAHEIRNIRTFDHAKTSILNYEKKHSMKHREAEAEKNALDAEAQTGPTHIEVTGDGSLMQEVERRIKELGLVSKSAENKFVHSFTTSTRPWLSKCSDNDLEELSQMLDILDAGVRTLPNDWYAAGHPPIKPDVSEPRETEEPTP